MILVQAAGNAFGLLVGERAYVDENDAEVARGLQIQVLLPIDPTTDRARAAVTEPKKGCGCG